MEDENQSCNGIITFEEAYRYQKSKYGEDYFDMFCLST